MKNLLIDKLIDLAIEEDINTGDITTESLIPDSLNAVAEMTAKSEGVISGLSLIRRVFEKFEKDIKWTPFVKDGEKVKRGDVILRIEAKYSTLLKGERISLNILQRMSGIATKTADYVNELKGYETELLDTRKTVPGMRIFDKQAVSDGGAKNHRKGLYDLVMIKDNHIKIAGSITKAVEQIRKNVGQGIKIEVETTNLDEVKEALECNVDIIMLDNMSNDLMKEAVMVVAGRTKTEASGNMTIERLKSVAETGVDYISVGALTHSVTALDISMNIKCA